MVAINPYQGRVSSLDADGDLLEAAASEWRCRERMGAGRLDEAVELRRARSSCLDCGFSGSRCNRKTPAGHARWCYSKTAWKGSGSLSGLGG